MLRQLDSRLIALRKISLSREAAQGKQLRSEETSSKRVRYTYGTNGANTLRPNASKTSTRGLKAVRRTVSESQPIIGDASNSIYTAVSEPSGAKTTDFDDLHESLRSLRNCVPAESYRLYQANFEWFASLLQSTQCLKGDLHPRSLLSMCLRKLPACVDDIVNWQQQNPGVTDGPSTSLDVSLDLCRQLEKFGHSGRGWAPLKQAVRAQAVSQLEKAVGEGLFPSHYVGLLVKLFARLGYVSESARLVSAMKSAFPDPRGLDDDFKASRSFAPLQALLEATSNKSESRGKNHVFRSVSHLLQNKRLSNSWIPTRGFRTILRRATMAIAQGDGGPHCLDLFATVLESLCNCASKDCGDTRNDEPHIQALIEILSNLIALALESTGQGTSETNRTETHMGHSQTAKIVMFVLDSCVNECDRRDDLRWRSNSSSILLKLARYFVGSRHALSNRPHAKEQTRSAVKELLNEPQIHEPMAYYVSLLIHATSQKISSATFASLCQSLEKLGLPVWFLSDVNAAGMQFPSVRGLDSCAIRFTKVKPSAGPLCVQVSVSGGWRWEEGIGEWVPTTTQVTVPGNLIKASKRRAYSHSFPNSRGKLVQVRDWRDKEMHETVIRSSALRPKSAGENSRASDIESLSRRGDGVEMGVIRNDKCCSAGLDPNRDKESQGATGYESLAVCNRLRARGQDINTKPCPHDREPLAGLPGKKVLVHGKENLVHAGKDLIGKHRTAHKSVQVYHNGRRPKVGGHLLIVSDGKHVGGGGGGKKRSRPPAWSDVLTDADWDNVC